MAIAGFLRQDYPDRELVILDDGGDPVADVVPDDPRIRYERLPRRTALGVKRNLACELAHGDILVHWDDDDWYAADRISTQVRALTAAQADVCGVSSLLFYDLVTAAAWRYRYPEGGRPWVAGSSMCFTKAFWERHQFDAVQTGEDTRLLWRSGSRRIVALDEPAMVIAMLHGRNTSRNNTKGSRWRTVPVSEVMAALRSDAEAYRVAARVRHGGASGAGANTSAKRIAGHRWTSVAGGEIRAICGTRPPARPTPTKEDAKMVTSTTAATSRPHPAPPAFATSQVVVSIPHRGPGDHLRAAVDSILRQSHADLTCVVVFDGDPTGTEAIADINDPRLVRHVLGENRGRYFADHLVLEATSSDFFLVQDSDDWSEPTRVERLLEALQRTGADVCVSDAVHHDRRSGRERVSRHGWPRLHDPIGPTLVHRAGHQGLYRTEILRSIGGWYAGHRIGFDSSVLNFVMLAGGRIVSVPEPLYHRNIRSGSLSTSSSTGWNTPERRRVVAELRTLHQRVFAATRGGTAPDAGSIIHKAVVAERRRRGDGALRREADRLTGVLGRAPQSGVAQPSRQRQHGNAPPALHARIPDVHEVLARQSWTDPNWSISAMAALELYRRLSTVRPSRILDVGSGLSTVVEASAAARYGGRVIGLEHDPRFAARTTAMLREAGLAEVAEVVVTPLVETSHPGGAGPWYDGQPVGTFDFIVVDGPPLRVGGRIAALPALAAHRRRDWELWLFDAHRSDEQRCLAAWRDHFPFAVSVERIDPTGVAVLRNPSRAGAPAPVLDRLGISLLTGGRPDVLERTLTTFASRWAEQAEVAHVVALVNGPDSASRDLLDRVTWVNRILTYDHDVLPIGMATSIAVAAVTGHPNVEHLMHLEDDWETRTLDVDALVRGAAFLRDPGVGQVRLRHRNEPCLHQHMISGETIEWRQRDDHRRGAAHFTFNPSLITRDVADRVFPTADERNAQRRFLATGLDVVQLEPGAFVHIGGHSRRLQLGRR